MALGGMSAAKGMNALFRRGNNMASSAIRLRAGAGLPVGTMEVPSSPLPENAELTWDDGSAFPEPCLDNVAPHGWQVRSVSLDVGRFGIVCCDCWFGCLERQSFKNSLCTTGIPLRQLASGTW